MENNIPKFLLSPTNEMLKDKFKVQVFNEYGKIVLPLSGLSFTELYSFINTVNKYGKNNAIRVFNSKEIEIL